MQTNQDTIKYYQGEFERWLDLRKNIDSPALIELRKRAFIRFTEAGIPTKKSEEWMYTPLKGLEFDSYKESSSDAAIPQQVKLKEKVSSKAKYRLVFINGHYQSELSVLPSIPKGAYLGSLEQALLSEQWADIALKQLNKLLEGRIENPFYYLNQAMCTDGTFFFLPEDTQIEEPIHLVFLGSPESEKLVMHPRNLIIVEGKSSLNIIESFIAPNGGEYWNNMATSFVVGEGAKVDHNKVQDESIEAWHIAELQAEVAENANFSSSVFMLGGATSRHEVEAILAGPDSKCELYGLYMPDSEQRMVNRIFMDHASANCESHQLYKGVLKGKGVGVFNGKIFVREQSQKTDAYQTNNTLFLSEDAEIYTKPQLEIFADDVKCSHGATSGYIDKTALFYILSRGIPKEEAERLLTYAFAGEVVQKCKIEWLREELELYLQSQI